MPPELIARMIDLLVECSDYLDNYVDVDDDEFGRPQANRAMTLQYDVESMITVLESLATK